MIRSISLKNISITKEKYINPKNKIFFAENIFLKYGDPRSNLTFCIIGASGRGKTVSLYAIADQFKNACCFDPKGGARDAIEFLGVEERWEFYKMRKIKTGAGKFLEINASDLVEGIENILSFKRRLEDKSRISNVIREFLSLQEEEKTYKNLKKIFEKAKLRYIMDDLEPLLSKTDSGMTLEDTIEGRKIIDIVGLSIENRCIAVYLWLIVNHKRMLKEKEEKQKKDLIEPFFVSCDDCQTYVVQHTALGKAFEISVS